MTNDWKAYLSFGSKLLLSRGSTIYYQGQDGSGLYYLEKGRVSIHILSEQGDERIINYIMDGHLIGESGVSGPHSTSAVCDTDVVLYYFPTDIFKLICKKYPEAKNIFMKSLSWKIRSLAENVSLTDKPYEKQMSHFILDLYKKYNGHPIPISSISIAKYLGTSRITVYKIIQKWTKEGLISQNKQKIEVLDASGMEALL